VSQNLHPSVINWECLGLRKLILNLLRPSCRMQQSKSVLPMRHILRHLLPIHGLCLYSAAWQLCLRLAEKTLLPRRQTLFLPATVSEQSRVVANCFCVLHVLHPPLDLVQQLIALPSLQVCQITKTRITIPGYRGGQEVSESFQPLPQPSSYDPPAKKK
jgi:hypothetical protein